MLRKLLLAPHGVNLLTYEEGQPVPTHDQETRISVIEERLRGMDEALRVRTAEISRRLNELNHAHEQAVQVQHTYVTEEIHDRDLKSTRDTATALVSAAEKKAEALALALTEAKQVSDERFQKIETFQAKLLGALALATIFIPGITALIVYVLTRHGIPAGK